MKQESGGHAHEKPVGTGTARIAGSERYFLPTCDALFLADHLTYLLIKSFRLYSGGSGRFGADLVCPYSVSRIPPVAGILYPVDDGLAWLILLTPLAKFDGHLAVLLALQEADTRKVISGDLEGIGRLVSIFLAQPSRRSWFRLPPARRLRWYFRSLFDRPVDRADAYVMTCCESFLLWCGLFLNQY